MTYSWNGAQMVDVATLPMETAKYLKIAGPTQLRVLLWIATVGKGHGDAKACSEFLGGRISVDECEDALRFWVAEGILLSDDAKNETQKIVKTITEKQVADKTPSEKVVQKPVSQSKKLVSSSPKKPRGKDFSYLMQTAEMNLGHTLSRADQEKLQDIYDYTHLPTEVIMMAISHAVSQDKLKMSYIQAICQSWSEEGILDVAAANEKLCYIERCNKCWDKLVVSLELDVKRVSISQKMMAEKWIHQLKCKQPLLQLSYNRCMEKTGKFQVNYMDKMLASWIDEGLTTPEKVEASEKPQTKKHEKKPTQTGGFDTKTYEKIIQHHTPKYRKKG